MARYRIGNDMTVVWSIYDHTGAAYNLKGKEVRLYYTCERGRFEVDFGLQETNIVVWRFFGREQKVIGDYTLSLEIIESADKRRILKDYCNAFTLVGKSCEEVALGNPNISEDGNIVLSSKLDVYRIQPIIPTVGSNSNWFVNGTDTGKPSTGKSAYEYAKEKGYEGTESEYAECLKLAPELSEELGKYESNAEYIRAYTDADGKFLWGIRVDGSIEWGKGVPTPIREYFETSKQFVEALAETFERVSDVENRSEITLDAEGKVLSFRDEQGCKHEHRFAAKNLSIEESLSFGKNALIDLETAIKTIGIVGGTGNWSDKSELSMPMPRCAIVNLSNIESMPTTKTQDLKAYFEMWDMQGNYFKKRAILNAQGQSSLGMPKKNFAADFCNDDWIGDDTFSLRIGDWIPQDSYHFKAYYADYFRGIGVVGYHLHDAITNTRTAMDDRVWKRYLLPNDIGLDTKAMKGEDDSLSLDNGARCYPDGFPCIVYLNGEFYGIFAWQLKKHRDNYNMSKKNAKHIHLDGNISNILLWGANGTISWDKWSGKVAESATIANYEGIEVRNPKPLILADGTEYDADENRGELIGKDSAKYDSSNSDMKRTAEVKESIVACSQIVSKIQSAINANKSASEIRELIETYLDVHSLIDYLIFSDVAANIDGFKKNWQWTTYDGIKWSVNPYDLDGTFGWDGWGSIPPTYARFGNDVGYPTYYIIMYYSEELAERYAELRNAKVIDTKNIYEELKSWVARIGTDFMQLDHDKWVYDKEHYDNAPEGGHVDNVYRVYNWIEERITFLDGIYQYNR